MSTPIPGYADAIPDDRLLGHIAWYTITQPNITHDQLEEIVSDLPLNKSIIPSKPRMRDAFKRACRYSERKGLELPGVNDQTVNFMIRKVTQNSKEVVRHLVLEIVDAEGETLEYHDVAHLNFNAEKETLNIRKIKINDTLDAMTQETLSMFTDNFDYATTHLDAQVIRLMIRQQLDLMAAISVRKQGSVYFIPMKAKDRTEALETLCSRLGGGSMFHALPLVDTSKQREMVTGAFEDEVHDEAAQLISELANKKQEGKQITVGAWEKYRDRFNKLKSNAKDYATLVDDELSKAKTEIEALDRHLTEFLTNDLVKT